MERHSALASKNLAVSVEQVASKLKITFFLGFQVLVNATPLVHRAVPVWKF